MMSSSGMNVSLRDLDEPRQHLLGHLHAREHLVVEVGVAQPHDQAQRQVRDVRERPSGADRERRQDREDLLAEVALEHLARRARLLAADDPDPVLGERRADHVGELARVAAVLLAHLLGDPLEHLGRGQPVGPAGVDPGLDLVVDAGDADHEELVEVGDEDREELQALDQRQRLVLGELEHAVVEVEPRQLAVDVQRWDRVSVAWPAVGDARSRPSPSACRDLESSGRSRSCQPLSRTTRSRSARRAAAASTSSPFAIPARPPFRIRACAPVRSWSVSENEGSWPTSSTSPSPAISSWTSNGSPASAGSIVDLDAERLARAAARSAARAAWGWSGRRRCAYPRRLRAMSRGLGLAHAALGQRALVVGIRRRLRRGAATRACL